MLQVTARVQRLGPHLLLHVTPEPRHHVRGGAPHPLAPDLVVEDVVHGPRVHFVDVGVDEGGSDLFDGSVAEGVSVVVIGGVVLDQSRGLELGVVLLGVA